MFRSNLLAEKTILITGGGTGLGKSMAGRFGELGARVVIASRKQEILEKTAAELTEIGIQVLPCTCDVRKPQEITDLVKKIKDAYGPIHGLVNNAAGNFISPTERLTPGGFKVIVDIVLQGTFNVTLEVGKSMIEQKGGTILNIVTTYAWTGSGYVVPSAAAKAGVLALTRSLAVEWAKYGIRSNAIAPGPFPTAGAWKRLVPPSFESKMLERIPLKRFGKHSELANLGAYLISDESGFINGEVVTMDGGEWLKGAGEFNDLENVPEDVWEKMTERRS